MRKEIKKWGNGAGLFLSNGELKLYGAGIGDVVDLGEIVVIKKKKKEKKKKKIKKKKSESVDDFIGRLPE